MRVIRARNVHQALPMGLQLLDERGVQRNSRNGPVRVVPGPVTTVYERPYERVLFWPQRDANPAFHLYEALWMLAGRDDVAPLARYARRMTGYSDDGETLHGAYGKRWRGWFGIFVDQLAEIAERLRANPEDRRCVLQMWSAVADLGRDGRDVPCNLTATLQRDVAGALDLVVFCRSNDVVWGCYGANAVHFSMMQEYLAAVIGCPVGTYTQVSVNWHAYEDVYLGLKNLPRPSAFKSPGLDFDPYSTGFVRPTRLSDCSMPELDGTIGELLAFADEKTKRYDCREPWDSVFAAVLEAHRVFRVSLAPDRYELPLRGLDSSISELGRYDWLLAMREWVERRYASWKERQS